MLLERSERERKMYDSNDIKGLTNNDLLFLNKLCRNEIRRRLLQLKGVI